MAAVAVLGPALGPGSLLGLDLVLLPRMPVPSGVWGLGPELGRRVPYGLLVAWAAPVGGSAVVGKALLALCVAGAFVGAWQLARGAPALARAGAGLLYALSPYLLTRVGVGHFGLVAAAAVLPFALPSLLVPDRDLRRTFLWAAALAFTGYSGGTLALVVTGVGLVAGRGRRAAAVLVRVLAAQLPWLVPGAVVLATGPQPAASARFATDAPGVLGAAQLLAGHGFWRTSSQVGVRRPGAALLGVGLVLLAGLGACDLPAEWGRRAAALAAMGFVLAVASAAPGLRRGYDALTATSLGAPLRESQRFIVLTLVWLAPAAAFGAARLGGVAMQAVPAGVALTLALPGLWGVDGRLQPVQLPASWARARSEVVQRPGTVLALPWHRYMDLRVAGGRRVFNPLPDHFGGDVLFSSDPELGRPRREGADPREPHAPPLLDELRAGRPVSDGLAALGVRWVALLHDVDWRPYAAGLSADPGLEARVRSGTLDLLEVRSWRGPVTDTAGRVVPMRPVVAPLRRLAGSGPARWAQPAARGWMRGWEAAGRTPNGLVSLPAGRGPVWFWPAVVSIVAQVAVAVAVARCLPRGRCGVSVAGPPSATGATTERDGATR